MIDSGYRPAWPGRNMDNSAAIPQLTHIVLLAKTLLPGKNVYLNPAFHQLATETASSTPGRTSGSASPPPCGRRRAGLAKLPRRSRNLSSVLSGRRRAQGLPLGCHRDGKPERRLGPKGSTRGPQGQRESPTGHSPQGEASAPQGAIGIGFRVGTGRKDARRTASAER